MIDSPGHVDFSAEVTAALRITDGALVVVDCVEGVAVQTETVLRQAMQEKIHPVLMINKIDRAILELKLGGEEMYQNFVRVTDMVNVIIDTYQAEDMGSLLVDPSIGSAAFGSGKDQWAFTLTRFARIYEKKFNLEYKKLMPKFWGDNYFNSKTKKFQTDNTDEDGKFLKRAFAQFIMDPICQLSKACIEGDKDRYLKMFTALEINLTQEQKEYTGKLLLKTAMQTWINAAECILEMMVVHLPSPRKAQAYRTGYLYEGPQDDPLALSMKTCNPKGPLMMYVSKMVPTTDRNRFFAFGRVFSGTISTG